MPVKVSKLSDREVKTLHMDFGEAGDLNVAYYPGRLTYGLVKRVEALQESKDMDALLTEFLSLIKSWDVQDDAGKVLPLVPASCEFMDFGTINDLIAKMQESSVPNRETSTS